jgi:hypothetical protein
MEPLPGNKDPFRGSKKLGFQKQPTKSRTSNSDLGNRTVTELLRHNIVEESVMPAKASVESISPFLVYKRVVFGTGLLGFALFWHLQNTSKDYTVEWFLVAIGAAFCIWGWNAVKNPRLALKYAYNPGRTARELIEEWTPTPARLESEYEQSLHKFLKAKLPFVKVTRQYGTARVKCDIAIGNHVIIEMKAGCVHPKVLSDLLGQAKVNLAMDVYDRTTAEDFVEPLAFVSKELLPNATQSVATG